MRHDRRNALRIIIIIPTRTEIRLRLRLPPPRCSSSLLHQEPQHAHLALDHIVFRNTPSSPPDVEEGCDGNCDLGW
jgi:hypothetical protein